MISMAVLLRSKKWCIYDWLEVWFCNEWDFHTSYTSWFFTNLYTGNHKKGSRVFVCICATSTWLLHLHLKCLITKQLLLTWSLTRGSNVTIYHCYKGQIKKIGGNEGLRGSTYVWTRQTPRIVILCSLDLDMTWDESPAFISLWNWWKQCDR